MEAPLIARLYRAHGRVQGVGFRAFVERHASKLGVAGWVRNVDDGSVEVHGQGTAEQLSVLEGLIRTGPRWGEVRRVDVNEAAPIAADRFSIKRG
ncbi:MAG: acylphosphatase [Acidobacteriota bacterium]